MTDETRVEWRDWGHDAFQTAAAEDRPVLLSLTATWCDDCHEMDAQTYADPRIAANVDDAFVPVRVDVDRHPRVRERYNMGGFPTTAFLTPEGELLTGAGYLGPDGMRQVLDSIREMWTERGRDAGRVPRALAGDLPPSGEVSDRIEEHLAGQLGQKYDAEYAGWGDDAKFPLPRTIEFALKRERDQALRTLDAIRDHLFDDVAGGFFRFAGSRDWGDVRHEKVLDSNAALVRAFATAYLYTGDEAYRDPAADTVGFLTDDLWTGTGVGGSLGPGNGQSYYTRNAEEREGQDQPRRDFTVFAGGNALAADALLAYASYTDDADARTAAERILDELDRTLVDGGVVTRYRAGDDVGESGLLEDSARVVAAFTRARQVTGAGIDVARAVADHAIETLHDEGCFLDGPAEGPAVLDRPFRPLDGNVEMADALLDLALVTGEQRYRDVARETIAAFASGWDQVGVQIAHFGSVAARLRRDPLVIGVGAEPGSDLHRAALRVADHEKVVVPNAHEAVVADSEIGLAGFADSIEEGTAVVDAGATAEPATTPAELMDRVATVADSE